MSRYAIDPFLFSSEEKIILKALLKTSTPLKISRVTNIPRSTVYFILEKLKSRGFVQKIKINKKTLWRLHKVEKTENNETLLMTPRNIKTYDNPESIVDFLYKFVSEDASRFVFFNGDHNPKYWGKYVNTNEGVRLNNLIRDKNLVSEVIASVNFIKQNEKILGKEWTEAFVDKPTEYHLIDSKYTNFNSQIMLRSGKVYIMNMQKPILYEISDHDIYKCFESIFEFIKDHTKKSSPAHFINTNDTK